MTQTEFFTKMHEYLKSKLPDVPEHTVQEIATQASCLSYLSTVDEVNAAYKRMRDDARRQSRRIEQITRHSEGKPDGVRKCNTCEHRYWHDPECSACNEGNGFKYYTAMNRGGASDG